MLDLHDHPARADLLILERLGDRVDGAHGTRPRSRSSQSAVVRSAKRARSSGSSASLWVRRFGEGREARIAADAGSSSAVTSASQNFSLLQKTYCSAAERLLGA